MSIRNTRPVKGNKYYTRKASGGYNPCIEGSPKDSQCDVLANCVGYVVGRFNEYGNYGSCKYLGSTNAENFINTFCKKGQKLSYGTTPKVGSVMVWAKGKTGVSSDGAGHVAFVEKVVDANTVYTSESGYGASTPFTYRKRVKTDGIWGKSSSSYTFLGFIYQPSTVKTTTTVSYYSRYEGTSYKIDEVFKAISVPEKYRGSYTKRKPVAVANGISNYTGTASQNKNLIALAKCGKLIKA